MIPSEKSEKIKFWIVIFLALVMVVVAYFRFWHKKDSDTPQQLSALTTRTQPAATQTTIERQADDPAHDRPSDDAMPSVERDIFRPLKLPSAAAAPPQKTKPAQSTPAPLPNLKLGGTIISGKESLAIINDRFVRTGDTIATFKVVRIEKNKVQLVSGIKNIELKMINNE